MLGACRRQLAALSLCVAICAAGEDSREFTKAFPTDPLEGAYYSEATRALGNPDVITLQTILPHPASVPVPKVKEGIAQAPVPGGCGGVVEMFQTQIPLRDGHGFRLTVPGTHPPVVVAGNFTFPTLFVGTTGAAIFGAPGGDGIWPAASLDPLTTATRPSQQLVMSRSVEIATFDPANPIVIMPPVGDAGVRFPWRDGPVPPVVHVFGDAQQFFVTLDAPFISGATAESEIGHYANGDPVVVGHHDLTSKTEFYTLFYIFCKDSAEVELILGFPWRIRLPIFNLHVHPDSDLTSHRLRQVDTPQVRPGDPSGVANKAFLPKFDAWEVIE